MIDRKETKFSWVFQINNAFDLQLFLLDIFSVCLNKKKKINCVFKIPVCFKLCFVKRTWFSIALNSCIMSSQDDFTFSVSCLICRYLHAYNRVSAFYYRLSRPLERQQHWQLGTVFLANLNKAWVKTDYHVYVTVK